MSDEQEPVPEIAPISNGPYRVTSLKTLEGFYGAQNPVDAAGGEVMSVRWFEEQAFL